MPDTQILSDKELAEVAEMFPRAEYNPYLSPDEVDLCEFCKGTIDDHKANCVVPHVHALCHTVRALRAGARARNILLLELGGRGELLAKEHVNPDALDGLVAVRNEFDRLRNLLIPNLESQLATAEQERDRFATLAAERHDLLSAERHANDNLRADNVHLNGRLGIQEGHCKRLQEELTRAVREVK